MSTFKSLMITVALGGALFAVKRNLAHEMNAQEIAGEVNAKVTLPLKIGDGVTLRTVSGYGKNLVFSYSLDTYERSTLDPQLIAMLEPEDKADICRIINEMRKARIDEDIQVTREYTNSYGSKIHSVQVAVSSCA